MAAGQHTVAQRGQQAVARQVAARAVAAEAGGDAASGVEVGDGLAVFLEDAGVLIYGQTALGMKQRAGDFGAVEGWLERAAVSATEGVVLLAGGVLVIVGQGVSKRRLGQT